MEFNVKPIEELEKISQFINNGFYNKKSKRILNTKMLREKKVVCNFFNSDGSFEYKNWTWEPWMLEENKGINEIE